MESVAQSIVSKFGDLIVEEVKEIRGLGGKVVHLRDELATMNAVLRVISEADQDSVDHVVREWEKQVHDLVYAAENCTDTYSLRVVRPIPRLTKDHIGGTRLTLWPRYMFARAKHIARYHYEKLVLQRALAADINALLARTAIVSERRARYCIGQAALPRSAACRRVDDPDQLQLVSTTEQANQLSGKVTSPAVHEGPLVFPTEQINDLVGKIKAPAVHEGLHVLSIVGFGGLGKTTLAMELCRQLEADFPCQAVVSVSQAFDARKDMVGLLAGVLQQICDEKPNNKQTNKQHLTEEETVGTRRPSNRLRIRHMNEQDLSIKIKELLDHKRCLIVVDDVWTISAWEAIRRKLPEKYCGSRIIVTTRLDTVAKGASDFVHHMEPLTPEASKELFMMRVFGSTEEDTCSMELESFMDRILDKCSGLPLAIVSIAKLLERYRSAEDIVMWERVSGSIGSQMESHPTLERMIALSYDHLPRHLKACMMFMSIFPKDYVVAKDRLLYRWIVEGLVSEKPGLTLLEIAEEYLNELVSRSMIQLYKVVVKKIPYGERLEVEGCRVHELILEIMVSKSEESNFVTLVGSQHREMPHRHDKVHCLSVHDIDSDQGLEKVEVMKLQYVRSLTTFDCAYGLGKLLDRLSEFKLMRVLDLEGCKTLQDEHMRDVCRLHLLRFLSLRGTNISEMPHKVGDLELLEILDIKNTSIGKKLPRSVTKLSKLESLRCNEWLLPRGLVKMKALREVDTGVLTGNDIKVALEIRELPELRVLSIRIDRQKRTDVLKEEFVTALFFSLVRTRRLQSLHIECCECGIPSEASSLDFLLGVSRPQPILQCLRVLSVFGHISQLPEWVSSLEHLTKFTMGWAELAGHQLFNVLCKLPKLQSIHLGRKSYEAPKLVARRDHEFPVLKILSVSECFTELTFEQGSMKMLETLVLEFGDEKMSVDGLKNLKNLKEVKLRGKVGNQSMGLAVKQLKTLSESNQIKVVEDWYTLQN